LEKLLKSLDPGLSILRPAGAVSSTDERPRKDTQLGQWLRATSEKFEPVIEKLDRVTDPATGLVHNQALESTTFRRVGEVAHAEAEHLILEIRAWADNAAALIVKGRPMPDLLAAAKDGDDDALLVVLQINAQLITLEAMGARVGAKIQSRDGRFLRRLARALTSPIDLPKNAEVGFIVVALWEAGLKRLTSPEIRGFLKTVGIPDVPQMPALERHLQRMGLKKYSIE